MLEDLVFPSVTKGEHPQDECGWLLQVHLDQEQQNIQHRHRLFQVSTRHLPAKALIWIHRVLVFYKNDYNICSIKKKKACTTLFKKKKACTTLCTTLFKVFVLYSFTCFTESTFSVTAIIRLFHLTDDYLRQK